MRRAYLYVLTWAALAAGCGKPSNQPPARRQAADKRIAPVYFRTKGVALARAATKLRPGDPRSHFDLGMALYAARQYGPAIPELESVFHRGTRREQLTAGMYLAFAREASGEPQEADRVFERILQLPLSPTDRSDVWLERGNVRWGEAHQQEAADCYRRSLTLNPRQAEAAFALGLLAASEGRDAEAKQQFTIADRDAKTPYLRNKVRAALRDLARQRPVSADG